ncbi:MAG TPA: methyltransferase domain-containing protein [Rhizobiales bacterium]|nr:methyltransferase domain-containing protein [Hyphomicrobiales bacterium]
MDIRVEVKDRYQQGANEREAILCCPVDYDPQFLKIIPQEILDRDYGCGDPSRYARKGDVVLDLGSGGGKICFISSQIVGPEGRVIGVDMTADMLELARRTAPVIAEKTGFANVEFRRGHIEDLRTDLDVLDARLKETPVSSADGFEKLLDEVEAEGKINPMIADNSIDLIVSNCVLNLVSDKKKKQLFAEMFRVLKPGGRVAVSDIVSDEFSPEHLKKDGKLWSGCISGALQEREFGEALGEAGFHGMVIDKYEREPWQIVEGIEYRSVTLLAYKSEGGPALDKNQAVIYKGPWKTVTDDRGHTFERGARMAVDDKTFALMQAEPYKDQIAPVPPAIKVTDAEAFSCCRSKTRSPKETKRGIEPVTSEPSQGSCC